MRYHIGQACAVTGYTTLYNKLDLLPDVSIAEEAQNNKETAGTTAIFETITSQSTLYQVMDDYTRTVKLENPPVRAYLNGDVAVRSSLLGGNCLSQDSSYYVQKYFDIQEDNQSVAQHLEDEHVSLLYSPLPKHLPTSNKDVLINMAAWDGNIERYSRLRRPRRIPGEISAVIRGIYYNTCFARWVDTRLYEMFDYREWKVLQRAIYVRFIMSNDLSRINSEISSETLPLMFWWPHWPSDTTLRELQISGHIR